MADITSDRIRELLSDPKNIELIAGIAGSGLLGGLVPGKEKSESNTPSVPATADIPAEETPAAESTSAVVPVPEAGQELSQSAFSQGSEFPLPDAALPFSAGSSDKRIALLKAIKPYVSDSKKERVDGLVKAISVAGILSNYTGGLFGNKF